MNGLLSSTISVWLLMSTVAMAAGQSPLDVAPPIDAAMQDNGASEPNDAEEQPKPSINVEPIGKPSIEGFGTLEQNNGGFAPSVWNGTNRMTADNLLEDIRSGVTDETLQSLTVRLLMTQATPPTGSGPNWFIERVNALIALGQDDKALDMIASLPASMANDPLHQIQVELLLLREDMQSACHEAANVSAGDADNLFWQKIGILCKTHAGKHDEAMVGMDILREQHPGDDPFFQEAVRRMGDKNAVIKSLPKTWGLFEVAVLRLASDPEKIRDQMDAFPPLALKYIAQDATLDPKIREKATIRAQQAGMFAIKDVNKTPETPFSRPLASDVMTLVTALGSTNPPNDGDNAVIARLALDKGITDSRRVERLLALMEPFGYKVPESIWQKLFLHRAHFDGDLPPAVLFSRLNDAAQAGHKGEVVMLSALIISGSDVEKLPVLVLLPVVKALHAMGFVKEARSIAYDAVKNYSGR